MVEFQNVYKSFNNKRILENFSYKFTSPGLYAIVGDSGKGKTTLLRLISHLDTPDRGAIKGSRSIAYSFQEYRLFDNLTVEENISLVSFRKPSPNDYITIEEHLKRLSLWDDRNKYPEELSGGMKQRVSLIRAFVSPTEVLLLDEPTKELDEALVDIVVEIIQEISKKKLVILALHSTDFAKKIGAQIIELSSIIT